MRFFSSNTCVTCCRRHYLSGRALPTTTVSTEFGIDLPFYGFCATLPQLMAAFHFLKSALRVGLSRITPPEDLAASWAQTLISELLLVPELDSERYDCDSQKRTDSFSLVYVVLGQIRFLYNIGRAYFYNNTPSSTDPCICWPLRDLDSLAQYTLRAKRTLCCERF